MKRIVTQGQANGQAGKYHLVMLLDEREVARGVVRLAVVDWDSDIKTRSIEKRLVFFYADGTERYGKCKGFSYEDFQLLIVNKDKILELMRKGPAEYPKEE